MRNIDIIVVFILACYDDVHMVAVWWQLYLGNVLHEVQERLVHTILVPGEHAVVEQAASERNAVGIQTFVGEPFEQFPQGRVVLYDPSVPYSPAHVLVLDDLGRHWFCYGE